MMARRGERDTSDSPMPSLWRIRAIPIGDDNAQGGPPPAGHSAAFDHRTHLLQSAHVASLFQLTERFPVPHLMFQWTRS